MRKRKFHLGALSSMNEEARDVQSKHLASFRVTSCSALQPCKVVSRGWDQLEKACQVTTVLSRVTQPDWLHLSARVQHELNTEVARQL